MKKARLSMADRASRKTNPNNFTVDTLEEIGRIDPDCMFHHVPDKDDENLGGFEIRFADGSSLLMTRVYRQ